MSEKNKQTIFKVALNVQKKNTFLDVYACKKEEAQWTIITTYTNCELTRVPGPGLKPGFFP